MLWPPLVVNMRIAGLIWRGTAYFKFVKNLRQLLPYLATLDELRASCHAGRRRLIFCAKLPAWRPKTSSCFTFYELIGFWELYIPFREYLMSSPAKVAWFPVTLHLRQDSRVFQDTSAGSRKLCILGHLGLVFIWSCFVSCLLFLLIYVSLRNLCSGTCRKIRFSRLLNPEWWIQVSRAPTVCKMRPVACFLCTKVGVWVRRLYKG